MYKKITEEFESSLFDNYNLTELMVLKKNGKRVKANESLALHCLLSSKLKEYGISLLGSIECNELTFRCISLSEGFPKENEEIIRQLYGYKGIKVHILLRSFYDFSAAFDYDVDSGSCELQRHRYGVITDTITFNNMADMLSYIEKNGYDNLFNRD